MARPGRDTPGDGRHRYENTPVRRSRRRMPASMGLKSTGHEALCVTMEICREGLMREIVPCMTNASRGHLQCAFLDQSAPFNPAADL